MQGGIDPGIIGLCRRDVAIVVEWRDLWPGNMTPSSPGGSGSIFEPQPVSDWPAGLGSFFNMRVGVYPGAMVFRAPVVGIVGVWRIAKSEDRALSRRMRQDWGVPRNGNIRRACRGPNPSQSMIEPVRLGFPHRAGRYGLGGTRFSSPG